MRGNSVEVGSSDYISIFTLVFGTDFVFLTLLNAEGGCFFFTWDLLIDLFNINRNWEKELFIENETANVLSHFLLGKEFEEALTKKGKASGVVGITPEILRNDQRATVKIFKTSVWKNVGRWKFPWRQEEKS